MSSAFLSGDPALARRSRYGDTHAARRLATRHLDRISVLAATVATTPDEAAALTCRGFRLALRGGRPFDDALVRAFGRLAAAQANAEQAQGRLLVLLVEVEGRPAAEVAALLGLPAATAGALLPTARSAAGPAHPARPCRGWGLVASPAVLTRPEREAGEAHLTLCRRCRDRRAAIERTRAQLLGSSAGVAAALAATQVVPLGGTTAGLGVALGGKAGVALVGTVASAVLATGGTVAVTAPQRFQPPPRPATSDLRAPTPSTPRPGTTTTPVASPTLGTPSTAVLPSLPVPPPSGLPRSRTPLPTGVPLPTALPTSLPVPLPTLPLPLPTSLELPELLP